MFSYAVADYSLREVAGLLTRERQRISDQAVGERLSKCAAWIESVLAEMLFDKARQVTKRRLMIVDGTVVNAPAAHGTDYRVHLCYDAISQASCGVKVTDATHAERLTHFAYEPLDIVLGDRL